MSGKVLSIEGKRFSQLVVIKRVGTDNTNKPTWLCRCDCGNEVVTNRTKLMRGDSKTCGDRNNKYHIEARLNEKTLKINDCWIWTGSKNSKNGYGMISINGTHKGVHRVRYELVHGEIPDGMYVLHTCDNRACTNPEHLWLGTYQDNAIDMHIKNRHYNTSGESNGRSKLTAAQVSDIRKINETIAEIAKKYEVSEATISRIINNRGWHLQNNNRGTINEDTTIIQ